MGEQQSVKSVRLRAMVHFSSLIYLAVLLFLVVNQQGFIERIVRKNFRITFNNVLTFFSSKDWQASLVDNVRQMINQLALLAIIQSVIIVIGLVLIGYFLWRLRKNDRWHLSEKLLVIGYVFLIISLLTILTKMAIETYQTYSIIDQRINSLSLNELNTFQEKLSDIFLQSTFKLEQLIPSIASLFEQLRELIQTTKNIAGIPNLVQQTWEQLLVLKNWLVGLSISSVGIILVGHLIEGIRIIKNSQWIEAKLQRTKRSRQIELNERLVEVIEQQQQLIELLSEDKSKT
ncbi:hypothetical protein IGL98_000352 [Enterococcus sp. DIV0840]|uniref:hypothetical protein n=1 Tax=Enterococcus TaxID=1350 RepID=UPI001A8E5107|nr:MULTISPECIES: hypothetical protein [Enterococcus]MBO0435638.1 hypothetical protein [Enterococcus sp. DIV0849a]MBO0475360.1 hypothetical protein [Enterococcus ureasiticus]